MSEERRGWCANLARARSVSQTPSADNIAALVASDMALLRFAGAGQAILALLTFSNEPSLS